MTLENNCLLILITRSCRFANQDIANLILDCFKSKLFTKVYEKSRHCFHAPDDSFPSDHGTVIFTFALAFLFWHRLWSGALLMVVAAAIAWSRVYLGVHWPLDMVGGFLVGLIGCVSAAILWSLVGQVLYRGLSRVYHVLFAIPIRKGWVRD